MAPFEVDVSYISHATRVTSQHKSVGTSGFGCSSCLQVLLQSLAQAWAGAGALACAVALGLGRPGQIA